MSNIQNQLALLNLLCLHQPKEMSNIQNQLALLNYYITTSNEAKRNLLFFIVKAFVRLIFLLGSLLPWKIKKNIKKIIKKAIYRLPWFSNLVKFILNKYRKDNYL